ncbi:hypothetical protein DEO72_LG5g1867 [Vigna unguiculata]|uniref:Uncharacterized protein n=1 Tax=Vigna unguiculata TaxID=3917 RepID=A0A4D6LZL1_VIGUN|nr:hypothetical protein DEO72_LG5g1867 [Vigna unguiculata]
MPPTSRSFKRRMKALLWQSRLKGGDVANHGVGLRSVSRRRKQRSPAPGRVVELPTLVGVVTGGFGRGDRVEFTGVGEDDPWSSRAASMEGRRGLSWLLFLV